MNASPGKHAQLVLLALATCAGMYTRSALGPLQEAVKHSLHYSDSQMALLQGLAMALPMAICALPLGVLADRISRPLLLVIFVALGPMAFVLSALASHFGLLFAARCLAGLCSIATLIVSYSLVGDLYLPIQRGRASMVLASGEIVGAPVSFALGGALLVPLSSGTSGGWVGWGLQGWRGTLLCMGAILVPAVLLMRLLRDPPRTEQVIKKPSLRQVLPELWSYRRVAMPMLLARAMVWIADGAVFVWAAPNFSRRFHLPPDRIGALMGTVLLVSGLLGPALGGPLADLCQRYGGPRRTMMALSVLALLSLMPATFALMPSVGWTAVILAVFLTLGFTIATAGVTLSIIVIPGELRGLYLGFSNGVGSLFFVGLAPLVVSALSGLMGGEAMIGRALTLVCVSASLLGAAVFAFSARYFPAGPTIAELAASTP